MNQEPQTRPSFSAQDALRIATDRFAVSVTGAEELPSDRDQNFLLREDTPGRKYVLKLAHVGEDPATLDFQNRMLEHLARAGFSLSKVLHATDGAEILEIPDSEDRTVLARLLTWVPGKLLWEVNPQTPALFRSLGAFLGGWTRRWRTSATRPTVGP